MLISGMRLMNWVSSPGWGGVPAATGRLKASPASTASRILSSRMPCTTPRSARA